MVDVEKLSSDVAHSSLFKQMFEKEFDIHIRMNDPGITRAIEIVTLHGEYEGRYIVMEWNDGVTLDVWLRQPQSLKSKLNLLSQLVNAVGYIHSLGVIHRDLKPSYMMVTHNGNYLKIIDFGLSDTDSYAILKHPAGTPGFMSPEQLILNDADVRNDIFSIGEIMKCLKLGWQYRHIIKCCVGENSRRYKNIQELRNAISNAGKWKRWCYVGVIIILTGVVLVVVSTSNKEGGVMQNHDNADSANNDSVAIERIDLKRAIVKEEASNPMPVSKTDGTKISVSESNRLTNLYQQGVRAFEQEAEKLDAIFDTITVPDYPYGFGLPNKAWKDFYYSTDSLKLTGEEYDQLYQLLQNYSALRYGKWKRKIDSLKNER